MTYYEFAKEELEQLDNGNSGSISFTSSSSDTLDSSDRTGQSTPEDRDVRQQPYDAEEDYNHHQQQHHGEDDGLQQPSGARQYTVHREEQRAPGGEETSGARQYRYCSYKAFQSYKCFI